MPGAPPEAETRESSARSGSDVSRSDLENAPLIRPSSPLFRFSFIAVLAAFGALAITPIVHAVHSGLLFGGDWAEYLYSGPAYFHREPGLYLYPYPVLPVLELGLTPVLGQGALTLAYATELVSGGLILFLLVAAYFACVSFVRDRWAALVGAAAFAGFPLYFYEVAWGGQAQLLSFGVGLVAISVLLRNGIPGRFRHRNLVVALLLTVSVASEEYAASFILGLVLLLFLALLATRPHKARILTGLVETLGIPVGAAAYLYVTNPTFTSPVNQPALWHYLRYEPIWPHLWRALTFQDPLLAEVYLGILVLYAAFRLVFRAPDPFRAWLVPLSALSALLIGLSVTPGLVADRSLYPIAFPFGFAVADLASGWPREFQTPRRALRPRWQLRDEEVAWTFPVLVVVSVAVTGLQFGGDAQIYPVAITGYSFNHSALSQLAWLSDESGGVIYDSPNPRVFQVEWITNRPLFPGPAYQPYLLTSANKQATSVLGTAISYGPRWIEDGPWILTDSEPDWGQPAPGFLIYQDGHLYQTIEGSDFLDEVTYSPSSNPSQTFTSALFYASTLGTSSRGATMYDYYNWTDLNAVRSLQVLPSGRALLNYSFSFGASIPRSISLALTSPGKAPTSGRVEDFSSQCSNASVSQSYSTGWTPPMDLSYTTAACASGAQLSTKYVPSDKYGIFELAYVLTPSSPSSRDINISFEITTNPAGSSVSSVKTAASALASNHIHWVVIDRSSGQIILQRFMDDSDYTIYRLTANYIVFSVN